MSQHSSPPPKRQRFATIDLTVDDESHGSTSHKPNANCSVMTLAQDEALARALQEEYDNFDQHSLQVPCPAEASSKSSTVNDEEYARQLQAQLDADYSEAYHENQDHDDMAVDPDEAYARMLQEQEDVYEGVTDWTTSDPSPIQIPSSAKPSNDSMAIPLEDDHKSPSTPALPVVEVEQTVRDIAKAAYRSRCTECGKNNLKTEADILAVAQTLLNAPGPQYSIPCPKCGRLNAQGARLTSIWTLLCGFDNKSKANKPDKTKTCVPRLVRHTKGNGTGYGGDYSGQSNSYSSGHDSFSGDSSSWYSSYRRPKRDYTALSKDPTECGLDPDDMMTAQTMTLLAALLPSYDKETEFDLDSPTEQIQSILLCSSMPERVAELFRNNSIEDILARKGLYTSLVRFVQTLAGHHSTSSLVFSERVVRSAGASLLKVSLGRGKLLSTGLTDTTQPLVKCLKELATQCSIMLQGTGSDPAEGKLFRDIKGLYNFLEANIGKLPETAKTKDDTEWRKELAVSEVADDVIIGRHSLATGQGGNGTILPGRMKRIMHEIANLHASLPENIFFRYANTRPDIMKFLIVGPKGTPYENGLFEFDMLCGADFPSGPPQVQFRSTGGGHVGFNPNLYADGKVCLSLLGTWSGEPWKPKESTLLQILVSIQAMIFCDKPWYNEPGRESLSNSDAQSEAYNRQLYPSTVQIAMIDWIERRRYGISASSSYSHYRSRAVGTIDTSDDLWDEIVKKHFASKQDEIISTVSKWLGGQPASPAAKTNRASPSTRPFSQGYTLRQPPSNPNTAPQKPTPTASTSSIAPPTPTLPGKDLLDKLRTAVERLKTSGMMGAGHHGVLHGGTPAISAFSGY